MRKKGWISAIAAMVTLCGSAYADDTCRDMRLKRASVNHYNGGTMNYEGDEDIHITSPYSSEPSKTFWDRVKPCEKFGRKIQAANKSEVEHNSSVEFSTNEDGSCNITFKLRSK